MVFFSCNACGDSVKKNQVEKHRYRCRGCTVLSCLDCSADFHGREYEKHVSCITEEAKYSGKGFKPKENANKGEKKQDEWLAVVRQVNETAKVGKPLKNVLEMIANAQNVPRKQKQFENFVKNCLSVSSNLWIKEAWNLVFTAYEAAKKPTTENETVPAEKTEDVVNGAKKPTKKERKEARRNQAKVEKKDTRETLQAPVTEAQSHEGEKPNRKRKRNHEANGTEEDACINGNDAEKVQSEDNKTAKKRKKNKNKYRDVDAQESCINGNDAEKVQAEDNKTAKKRKKNKNKYKDLDVQESHVEQQDDEPSQEIGRGGESDDEAPKSEKFRWTEVIKALLEAADEKELALKRLKKKVVAEYSSRGYSKATTKEQLEAKLLKKIQKNPTFKLHKERVKLNL